MENALRSILWQTYRCWELVIVDDGSTDGSLEMAQRYARQDQRIRVISCPHRGISATLNEGIARCSGEWIARMDSDDIAAPRRLESQITFALAHPDLDVIGSYVRLFPRRERTLGMRRYERWLNRYSQSEELARDIFVESPLVHPSVLLRRSTLLAAGGYRECPWPEDYDLWMRLWQRGKRFAKVPEVLLFWRDSDKRLTRIDARCSHQSLRDLKLHYLIDAFFPECHPGTTEPSHRPALVWGAGTNGKDLVKDLRARGLFPTAFVDNHPSRRGQKILGIPVLGLDQVSLSQGEFIIMAVSNPYTRAEVRQRLEGLGAVEGQDFACLANMAR